MRTAPSWPWRGSGSGVLVPPALLALVILAAALAEARPSMRAAVTVASVADDGSDKGLPPSPGPTEPNGP